MSKSKKKCETSIRVLETLKYLDKNSASIQDIICYFQKIDPNNRIYTNEVILKYINTFKVFKLRFTKEKDKYVLLDTLDKFNFDEKDLNTIYLLEKFARLFPEEKIKKEINVFLQKLEKRFDNETKLLAKNISRDDSIDIKIDYNKYSSKIKEYEQYCVDGQRIKITYRKQNKIETSILVEPNEIKYIRNEVYLSVYNPVSAQTQDINLNFIINVEQLPLKANLKNMYTSVTFQLKDRLANAYKLHDGEELLNIRPDRSIVILNKREDHALLLKRLIRYGENCEVLSPKALREEMKQIINATLHNYY